LLLRIVSLAHFTLSKEVAPVSVFPSMYTQESSDPSSHSIRESSTFRDLKKHFSNLSCFDLILLTFSLDLEVQL